MTGRDLDSPALAGLDGVCLKAAHTCCTRPCGLQRDISSPWAHWEPEQLLPAGAKVQTPKRLF